MQIIMTNAAPPPAALRVQLFQILAALISDEERAQMMQVHEAIRSASVQPAIKAVPSVALQDSETMRLAYGDFYMGPPEPLSVPAGRPGPKPARPPTQYTVSAERWGSVRRALHRRYVAPTLRKGKTEFDEAAIQEISDDIKLPQLHEHKRVALVQARCDRLGIATPKDPKALRRIIRKPRA